MKRTLVLAGALALGLLSGLTPASAVSTPVATQENVRHLATVPGNTGGHVVAEGNRLYMGNYGTGLSAYDISDPRNPVKIGQYLPGPSATDGVDTGVRADAVPDAAIWDGRHIVSLGGTLRGPNRVQTEFIDFTDPANPQLLRRFAGSNLSGGADGESHNGDIVDARKLFLPSGGTGNNGLRIYDMRPLLNSPAGAPARLGGWNPHSLWQNSPYRINYGKAPGSVFDHTHDLEVYTDLRVLLPEWEWEDQDEDGEPDPTYGNKDVVLLAAALGGNNGGAVYVIDITNPRAPVAMGKWENTSGNTIDYLHEVQFLHGDPSTLVVTDEHMTAGCAEGALYTVRISENLSHMTKLGEWTIDGGAHDTPGTCMGSHVISSHDRHVFMGAYTAGLQVIDLRNPAQPRRAGRYIAEGQNSWGALYHQGVVYTGDFGGRGLDVFEFIKDPVAKAFVKAGHPQTAGNGTFDPIYGVSEELAKCAPDSQLNGVDGFWVRIPEDKRDGTATFRALGSGPAGLYDVDVWFMNANCSQYVEPHLASEGTDEEGLIPEGAAYAVVSLYMGSPQWVYAQIL
ncbi:MAG TPA: hypothetical protein VM638_02375 [Actinomycetota bacterium]|nr:hypothetical protein [Actinomycetota bacterium]